MAQHLTRPEDSVASVLHAVYGPEVSSSAGELSLKTSEGTITQLSEILEQIASHTRELAFGSDAVQTKSWVDRLAPGLGKEQLGAIDQEVKSKTYLVGNTLTAADTALCVAAYPHISTATHEERLQIPSLTRHFDLVQHSPILSKIFSSKTVSIDHDNVPFVTRKAEAKPKKEKAPKDSTAQAADKPKESAKQQGKGAGEGKPKKEKKEKASAAVAQPPADSRPAPHMIDLRVGKIVKVERHPDADSLYVEQIDLGEPTGPRTVVSGLVKYMTLEQMQDRYLVAVCNLKPANMRGIKSFAMVMAASSKDGKDAGVELVEVPEGSQPGDRVYFEGFEAHQPLETLNPKKKIFETVQPGLTTLDTREAAWVNPEDKSVHKIKTDKGYCKAPTFVGASLS